MRITHAVLGLIAAVPHHGPVVRAACEDRVGGKDAAPALRVGRAVR